MHSNSKFLATILKRPTVPAADEMAISNRNYDLEDQAATEDDHGETVVGKSQSFQSVSYPKSISTDISAINTTKILHNLHDLTGNHQDQERMQRRASHTQYAAAAPQRQHQKHLDLNSAHNYGGYNKPSSSCCYSDHHNNNLQLNQIHYEPPKSRELTNDDDDVSSSSGNGQGLFLPKASAGGQLSHNASTTHRVGHRPSGLDLYDSLKTKSERMKSVSKSKLPTCLEKLLLILIGYLGQPDRHPSSRNTLFKSVREKLA